MRLYSYSQLHDQNQGVRPRPRSTNHNSSAPRAHSSSQRKRTSLIVPIVMIVIVIALGVLFAPKLVSLTKKTVAPPPPPMVSLQGSGIPPAIANALDQQIVIDPTHYKAATESPDLQVSVHYSGQMITTEQQGVYLVPVVHYKELSDSISVDKLNDYTVVTLSTLQPALQQYFSNKDPSIKVIATSAENPSPSTTPSPTTTPTSSVTPTAVTPTPAAFVAELDQIWAQINTGYKKKQKVVAFIPVQDLSSRFKVISWDKTNLLQQVTTKNPQTTPTILSFIFTSVVKIGLTPEQQALVTPVQQALQTKWTEIFPPFDPTKVSSVRITGVTAISRQAATVTDRSGDPAYMAGKIAGFLTDADLTHTSNEVSFSKSCQANLNTMRFCANPKYIQALEKSGMDIIELTGNHNNDFGASNNTYSINLYKDRKWDYFGGGLDATDAAKILYKEVKGSKIAFIGYNYYDSIYASGALAGTSKAGANSYTDRKMKRNIEEARKNADIVMVHFQFQECWAYTAGNTLCYKPISSPPQQTIFRKAVDYGADIVVGTQAHQPQTYENYKGKMIFYGLGNLFFDQDEWLGTRQGLILTHYLYAGSYLTTGVTTTIYDGDLRPYVTTGSKREQLLKALQ